MNDFISQTLIPGYTFKDLLGQGGMGEVWLARQDSLNRDVAIKLIRKSYADTPEFVARFKQEAQAAAQLNHPNIIAIYELGTTAGFYYQVMPYLSGGTLRQRLGSLGLRESLQIIRQIADGLEHAHHHQMVHRDIKPANILFDKRGNPVIADFGVVKLLGSDLELTRTGLMPGSPLYMSPEQQRGGAVDRRSDIYSLGLMFYEMLSGQRPSPYLHDVDHSKNILATCTSDPELSMFTPVLHKMLAFDPDQRYSTLKDFIADIDRITVGLINQANIPTSQINRPDPEIPTRFQSHPKQEVEDSRASISLPTVALPPKKHKPDHSGGNLDPQEPTKPSRYKFIIGLGVLLAVVTGLTVSILVWNDVSFVSRPETGTLQHDWLQDGSQGLDMVFIRGGRFTMGSPEDEQGRNPVGDGEREWQHQVTVDDFYIGQYAVTVGQFRRFVQATGYQTDTNCYTSEDGSWAHRPGRSWHNPGFSQTDHHPVVCVSWNDAHAYAQWLSEQTGQSYRLPTEAEWEYAARAGTTTARFWGENPDQACYYANVADQTRSTWNTQWTYRHECNDGYWVTSPVGYYLPNPWGLYDMLGNVWEWTCSQFALNYGGSEQQCAWEWSCSLFDSKYGEQCDLRPVVRGGSWINHPSWVRSAHRDSVTMNMVAYVQGFRLVRLP